MMRNEIEIEIGALGLLLAFIHSFFGSSFFIFVATDIIISLGSGNDNHDSQRISSPIYKK
jgi:hypothetical protein